MRILKLLFVVSSVLVVDTSTAAGQSPAAQPDQWPQFRGTRELTGVSAATVPSDLKLLWTLEAGDSIDSSAAIFEGTVYVGTYTGELIAVDLDTGTLEWTYLASEVMGIGESSPAVGDGLVYIGDLGGVLHAVDRSHGAVGVDLSNRRRDQVFTGRHRQHASWSARTTATCMPSMPRTAICSGTSRLGNYVHATPAIFDGVAYFGGCDEIFRGVRVADGKEIVSMSAGSYTAASPTIAGGRAYFGTFDNEVIGLDLASEEVLWRYEHPRRHFPFYSSALNVDGKVVIGGRDRMVHAIDAASGAAVWTFMTRARVDSSPATAGGRVYIGSSDGRLYVLDLNTGDKLWEFDTGRAAVGVAGDRRR